MEKDGGAAEQGVGALRHPQTGTAHSSFQKTIGDGKDKYTCYLMLHVLVPLSCNSFYVYVSTLYLWSQDPLSGEVDPELEREAKEKYQQELLAAQRVM